MPVTYHVTLQVTNSFNLLPECVATRLTRSLPFVGVAAFAFGNVSSEGVNVPFNCGAFSCKNDIKLSAVVVVEVEIYW
jgi:hypothetical protein